MKILRGISAVAALLIAGVATPSFATTLAPGTTVTTITNESGVFSPLANSPMYNFSFGSNTGQVQEYVGTFGGNPFGASDITFIYQVEVTAGHIVNLTSGTYAIPGITIDVGQAADFLPGFTGTLKPPVNASLTTDETTLGFEVGAPPDGLMAGMTSYVLIVNTNMTNFQPGVFSLQDDQTGNFAGFIPSATPEPSTLSLLGTGLLAAGAGLRRKMLRK